MIEPNGVKVLGSRSWSCKEREREITEIEKITEIDRRELLAKSKIIEERSKSPSSTPGESEKLPRSKSQRSKEEREITEIDGRKRFFTLKT